MAAIGEDAMSIKHILVPLTGYALSRESLQAGMDLAGLFGACAHVVHIRQDPTLTMAYAGAGAGGMGAGAGMAAIMEAAEGEAAERERRDRQSTRLNSSHYCATRMPSSA